MPIIGIAFGASLSLVVAYALVRWSGNIARGMVRGQYQWRQRLLPPALHLRPGASVWPVRVLVLLFAAGPAAIGVVLCATLIGLLIEAVRGTLPPGIWDAAPKAVHPAHSSLDVVLWTLFAAFLLPVGLHYILARAWYARALHWFWDVHLPIDAPYPKKGDPAAPPCHPRYVTASAVMGVIMILGGIACVVVAARMLQ